MDDNKKTSSVSMDGTKFINPEYIIEKLELGNGAKVAVFGCGTGYFAIPVAKIVAPDGIVFALDVRKEKLEVIESQAKLLGITNMVAQRANLESEKGSGLPDASADWVIMATMLFQNRDKNAIFSEAKRVLKKTGKILVVEWNEKDLPIGPEQKIKISKKEMLEIARKNGFNATHEMEASNFHYGLILVPHHFSTDAPVI